MNKESRLPNIIIGGAAKSGTTSLYNILSKHPRFYFPEHKEPYFFSFKDSSELQCLDSDFSKLIYSDYDSYIRLFQGASEGQIIGEASTSYLYTADLTIEKIKRTYRDAGQNMPKMYFVLRNPIDRAFSHYLFLRQRGVESLEFVEAIKSDVVRRRIAKRAWDYDYVDYGMYSAGVKKYLDSEIPVKFFLLEDISGDGLIDVASEICRDFGESIECIDVSSLSLSSNPSGVPKNELVVSFLARDNVFKLLCRYLLPMRARTWVRGMRDKVLASFLEKHVLSGEERAHLADAYRPDVDKLSLLLERNMDHWK